MKQACTNNLLQAKSVLEQCADLTCVLQKEDALETSTVRGVLPLLQWIEAGRRFSGYAAADRVVGAAAAYLYVLLDVQEVYAPVMSERAIVVLSKYGITAMQDVAPAAIRNRAGTGMCPMEAAVADCKTPEAAYDAIRRKLQDIRQMHKVP